MLPRAQGVRGPPRRAGSGLVSSLVDSGSGAHAW